MSFGTTNFSLLKKFEMVKTCESSFWLKNMDLQIDFLPHISRQNVSRHTGGHGFPGFWDFFYYIRLFRAPRRFLGAVKIAIES